MILCAHVYVSQIAAQSSDVLTSRKTYSLGDICILCGFSFVNTFIDSGKEVTQNDFDKKKVNRGKKTPITTLDVESGGNTGVCQKCFRAMEKLNKIVSLNPVIQLPVHFKEK